MTDERVSVERHGAVELWTLELPGLRNPISDADMIGRLVEVVDAVNDCDDVRAVVLTGRGSVFSAGGNVKEIVERAGMFGGTAYQQRRGYLRGIQRIPRAIYDCEVPIVAAVNGPAIGAGCDLALMCDLRVASSTALFAESFVKLGLVPGDGGAWLLPAVVGQARAAEMLLTGDSVSAETALEWGLVSAVVSPETLIEEALGLAERVAANPSHATRLAKRLLRESKNRGLGEILELSAAFQALAHHTDDHREALLAMVEKRTPRFD